jgi:ankyrin repeat protein
VCQNLLAADGRSPLYAAAERGHSGSVRRLLRGGADVTVAAQAGKTPLFIAAENGYADVVRELLDAGADVRAETSRKKTPLYAAVERNHFRVVTELLRNSIVTDLFAVTQFGSTPMFLASKHGTSKQIRNALLNFCIERIEAGECVKALVSENTASRPLARRPTD